MGNEFDIGDWSHGERVYGCLTVSDTFGANYSGALGIGDVINYTFGAAIGVMATEADNALTALDITLVNGKITDWSIELSWLETDGIFAGYQLDILTDNVMGIDGAWAGTGSNGRVFYYPGQWWYEYGASPQPVPEPGTIYLFCSALLGLGGFKLRRKACVTC